MSGHNTWRAAVVALTIGGGGALVRAEPPAPAPQPVPLLQALPQPDHQVSFQRDGLELARYHFGPSLLRPFVFPLIGPSGRPLTRMGHPHDPQTHGHHTSVWIGHRDVNGLNFWEDGDENRIVHRRIEALDDGPDAASVVCLNAWTAKDGSEVMLERRRTSVQELPNREWMLLLDVSLEAQDREVTLGQSPFGLLGVRMARTIGVTDGGGTIRNSEGGVNEAGAFRKHARWVDYAGPITATATEGVTLMDHPSNPNHPAVFHLRDDGWMGASLTFEAPRTIPPGRPLRLRYGLYVHAGAPPPEVIRKQWEAFSRAEPFAFPARAR